MTHTEKSGIEFKYLIVNERDRKFGLWVNTVGYQSIPPRCAYPLRDHPSGYFFNAEKGRVLQEYQLVYIVRGRGTFASGSAAEREVGEGQLILLFPGLWHTYSPLPKTGWTEYYIGFEGETIDRLAGESFLTEKQQVLDIGINEELTSLFIRALAVAEADKTAVQQYLAGIVLHMVGLIQSASKNRVFETGNIDARTEGMSCMGRCYVQFQQKAALRQTDMFWSKGLNLNAPISCQTVFSTLVQDCTDTSAEGASEKWNIRKRNHNRTWLGEIIALHP